MILGIDPGQQGAIVALHATGYPLRAWLMPAVPKVGLDLGQMAGILDEVEELGPHVRVVLERAQAMPKQGISSTFKYARDFGRLEALLWSYNMGVELVSPATWHRQLVGGGKPTSGGEAKARALQVVRQRLPALDLTPGRKRVPHDGIVDAACLALWGLDRRAA